MPLQLTGPLADFGPGSPEFYQVVFNKSDLNAIDFSLLNFKSLGIPGNEVSTETFPLPINIRERLTTAAVEIHQGRGICQIKGLDPTLYSEADNLLVYLAIANYIADKRGIQDKNGTVISHVTDAKSWSVPYGKRHRVHTNQDLTWHCDMGADILALQVRQVAAEGGSTLVASSWKVYNDIVTERPDVIETLMEPNWPVHMSNRKARYVLAPLMDYHDGKLLVNFDPSRLGTHPNMKFHSRNGVIPELTKAQLEALRIVAIKADQNCIRLDSKPGDILFINNWALIHARSAYTDASDKTGYYEMCNQRRHLLRLWLRSSQLGWQVPDKLRAPLDVAFGYATDSCVSTDRHNVTISQLKYPVTPEPEYIPARYTTGSAAFAIDDSEGEYDD